MARRGIIFVFSAVFFIVLVTTFLVDYNAVFKINQEASGVFMLTVDDGDRNSAKIKNNLKSCETIHIGIVCSGYSSNHYLHTMLKSILFYRTNPLHFHILVDDVSRHVLATLFDTWDLSLVEVTLYDIKGPLEDVRWVPNTHYSGIFGLLKLTFAYVLPEDVSKLIVLDTDLTFVSDIYELWQLFDNFSGEQVLGLTENESNFYYAPKAWPALGRGYNSGLVLYNLKKLRDIRWHELWTRVTKATSAIYGATLLGDQDIINAVLIEQQELLYTVPCYWNTQMSDYTDSYNCYENETIKVIHWNSPRKTAVQNRDSYHLRFKYRTFLEMNGDLVKQMLYCTETKETPKTPSEVCHEFKAAAHNKWRTLLFFKSFDYVPLNNDITFVGQLSYDRLYMVEELTKYWEGPISLTLYVTDPELQQAIEFIDDSQTLQERTNIAYHAVFKCGSYHPINVLRNVGLENVNTPYVFLADIDFLPMPGLYNNARKVISGLSNMNKNALVVPAFETQRYRSRMPKNKNQLLQMMEKHIIYTFRTDLWRPGHAPTNFLKWQTATSPYTVDWKPDFEPYILVQSNVTRYDRRFVGFGWNKVSHIMELHYQNYQFTVLDNGYMVHNPHSVSNDIIKFRQSATYRMCLKNLKDDFVKELKQKYSLTYDDEQNSQQL